VGHISRYKILVVFVYQYSVCCIFQFNENILDNKAPVAIFCRKNTNTRSPRHDEHVIFVFVPFLLRQHPNHGHLVMVISVFSVHECLALVFCILFFHLTLAELLAEAWHSLMAFICHFGLGHLCSCDFALIFLTLWFCPLLFTSKFDFTLSQRSK